MAEPGLGQATGKFAALFLSLVRSRASRLTFEISEQTMAGTITMMNQPPSRNGTLDDDLDITPVGGVYKYRQLLDTVGGSPFCFVYE